MIFQKSVVAQLFYREVFRSYSSLTRNLLFETDQLTKIENI